ncbi:glycosyltransferase family 4 protein [Streptomyces sp. PKU-EA00015]|uniref:glycosyltransferase family 4 protein n=1 Tax=Streptomyces sp. PKU-EA00015 TaxID=2748326 RepID=UPI0015A38881|nr:glycosyltransferase family 4 protein [Streptomyces sp. PKU-EA00015]NWF25239.1 glycosyltransferase family 4 protein [Streptomyces sp. PKU-EA00015]
MRLVARLHGYPPRHNAGAEWMVHSMLRALVERGHDVAVWLSRYTDDREAYDLDGVRIVPLQTRLDAATAIRQADVVVSHLENVPSAGALARGYGKPLAVVCHNTHLPSFRQMASGSTALAVYNSQWMAREAELFFAEYPKGIRPKSSLIVRPPVFAEEYRTKPGDKVTLINCNLEKGGQLFEKLARRMPDVQFLAVRGAYGEQILPDLPNVEILGHLSGHEMREKVYSRTKVLLMPSSYESWGRAGVEALASGLPVVAHPTPGLCESLGEAGVFVDLHDADGYESVIRKLLSDPAEYRLVSKRAKARSAELDPTADLATWCDAVEALAP